MNTNQTNDLSGDVENSTIITVELYSVDLVVFFLNFQTMKDQLFWPNPIIPSLQWQKPVQKLQLFLSLLHQRPKLQKKLQ